MTSSHTIVSSRFTRNAWTSRDARSRIHAPLQVGTNEPENPRAGIDVSQIKVGGGAIGLFFSVATVAIFMLGIPSLIWFPAGTIAFGALISMFLRFTR